MAIAQTQPIATAPPNVKRAVAALVRLFNMNSLNRPLAPAEGRLVYEVLKQNNVTTTQVPALIDSLGRAGKLADFFQTAHPHWGPQVRGWLAEHEVPWSTVHAHYEYDWRDSADFYIGFLAGMGVAIADLPIMLGKLGQIVINGRLAEEANKFFDAIEALWAKELKAVLEEAGDAWLKKYEEHVYKLEWHEAGFHVGNTVTNVVIFGKGAAKGIASLPKFVKAVPAAVKDFSAAIKRTAGMVVKTAKDAMRLIREAFGAIFLVPDLRYSRLLAAMLTPGEIRRFFSEEFVHFVSKSGYEMIYIPGRDAMEGFSYLGAGPLPTQFVGSSVVIIRRGGKIVARIHRPRSLAAIIKDLTDDDWQGLLKKLEDIDAPPATLSQSELAKLVDRARNSADFATTVLTFNARFLLEEYINIAKLRLATMLKALKPGAVPNAAAFGTLVESDMKPVLAKLAKEYPHLTFYRGETLEKILAPHLPKGSRLLEMTVEEFVRENGLLSAHIGYDGSNLAKVMMANPTTKLGALKVDLLLLDQFGHQGMLLDWTSFFSPAHFNKTLLYHAIITDVFKNLRLPAGEMFHFGLTQ